MHNNSKSDKVGATSANDQYTYFDVQTQNGQVLLDNVLGVAVDFVAAVAPAAGVTAAPGMVWPQVGPV